MSDAAASELLVVDAAGLLHRYGLPAHRLEGTLLEMARQLGLELRVFATPTALTLAFGPLGNQRLALLRVVPAAPDLGRLSALDAIVRDLCAGRADRAATRTALDAIDLAPRPWPAAALWTAGFVASAGSAVLFRGSPADVVAAGVIGLAVTAIGQAASRSPAADRVQIVVSAFVAMALARVAARALPDVHALIVTLSALIVLLPGWTFTLAAVELASRHLASGTARLGAAGVSLLQLGLGIAVARAIVPLPPEAVPGPLPALALPLTLLLVPPSMAVLLGALRADVGVIVVASLAAYAGAELGLLALGPGLGAGVGAFVLGIVSNLWSRAFDRPASVPMTPGLLLLVPGSFGVRSMALLLEGEVVLGVERAFDMALVTMALAAGLVLSSTVLPARRPI